MKRSHLHPTRAKTRNVAVPAPVDLSVGLARSVFHSSIVAMQGWLEYVEQLRDVGSETLDDLNSAMIAARESTERATSLPELLQELGSLTVSQMQRGAQRYGSLISRLFSIEAELIRREQAEAAVELNALRQAFTKTER